MDNRKILAKGAESVIYLDYWFGKIVICKHRILKRYRVSVIDDYIRRRRTLNEVKNMIRAKSFGVCTPTIYDVDLKNCVIRMEFLEGVLLRDIIYSEGLTSNSREYVYVFGTYIGKLHKNGLIHGDPVPTNVIVSNSKVYLIDFGLSEFIQVSSDFTMREIEKFAEDLNVTFRAIETMFSKFANEINSDNWYKILLRNGVEYGHSDPNADPCGYRTLLVWQLAEKYYKQKGLYELLQKNCPKKNIRSAEVDLIALLEAGELDYLFIYRSVAWQHRMKFVTLPDEINLKDAKYKDFYKQAQVKISGKKPGEFIIKKGAPMVYGFTVPQTVQNKRGAVLFADFILSEQGKRILEQNGQPCIIPPVITGNLKNLPMEIKKYQKR